jgi:hypothetical protein
LALPVLVTGKVERLILPSRGKVIHFHYSRLRWLSFSFGLIACLGRLDTFTRPFVSSVIEAVHPFFFLSSLVDIFEEEKLARQRQIVHPAEACDAPVEICI